MNDKIVHAQGRSTKRVEVRASARRLCTCVYLWISWQKIRTRSSSAAFTVAQKVQWTSFGEKGKQKVVFWSVKFCKSVWLVPFLDSNVWRWSEVILIIRRLTQMSLERPTSRSNFMGWFFSGTEWQGRGGRVEGWVFVSVSNGKWAWVTDKD